MKNRWAFHVLVTICLFAVLFAPASSGVARAASPAPDSPSGSQALPAALPVFRLAAPPVTQDTLQMLQRSFPGIGRTSILSDTTFAGSLSLSSINAETGASLQQFVATGGFFATNVRRAFAESPAALDYSPAFVCNLLKAKGLFPAGFVAPEAMDCAGQLPYHGTPIYLATLTPGAALSGADDAEAEAAAREVIQTGVSYQVPLAVDIGAIAPLRIPLGGPGGHLSILLTGFGDQESLDPQFPGLNAIASPMNGRMIEKTIGTYPVVSQEEAIAQLRAALPAGTRITPGHPGLVYFVDHPAVTQTLMMPTWVFTDTQATVGDQQVDLKGLTLPGVSGFLPDVQIISPMDNAIYFPGRPLTVTGAVDGGGAPFTYRLEVEGGALLTSGVTPGGTLRMPLGSVPLPSVKGSGDNVVLRLSVTDANGATNQDTLLLLAPPKSSLPLLSLGARGLDAVAPAEASLSDDASAQSLAGYSMGVEWIQYYNGTNPDLAGVPPDANGFYNRLLFRGWTGRFNYGNNLAWEKDWRDCSLGGIDCSFGVDRAEFVYFSGHGSPARIYFGVNKDALSFFGGDARFQNVRWAAFSSCQTLRAGPYVATGNPPLTYWFNAFQGAYMLLGFHSNMADVAFGGPLADNMRLPLFLGTIPLMGAQPSIREAWVMTAFQMNAGKPAYLYAVGNFNPVDFKLPDKTWSNYATPPLTGIYQYRWVWWG